MTGNSKTTVMIVDDHAIMRNGLTNILSESGEFEVVGEAADGESAVAMAVELRPNIVVMDILMPIRNGIEACREIVAAVPETRVLMLTASNAEDHVVESIEAGATGYLQKYSDSEMLLSTVREVAKGDFRIQGEAARRLFAGITGGAAPSPQLNRLTARERETLRMFAKGMSYKEIGVARRINPMSVRNTIYAIQRKLGVKTRQELGVWAARNGLLCNDELQ